MIWKQAWKYKYGCSWVQICYPAMLCCVTLFNRKVLLYCYIMRRKQIHHATIQCHTFSWEVTYRNSAAVLKLMCIMCLCNRVEVPNDEVIAQVFQDALRVNQLCSEHWAVTSTVDSISMHMSCEMVLSNTHTQLLFLQGKLCTAKRQHFSRDVW